MPKIDSIDFDKVEVYRLHKDLFNINDFCCGKVHFDNYLRKEAFTDQKQNVGKIWVFVYDNCDVIGYVSLAMSHLNKTRHQKLGQLPHTNIPGLLLGQIATHQDYQNLGVGKRMIDWVISQGVELSEKIGCRLLILDAEKDVVEWYTGKLGFIHIPTKREHDIMFYDLVKYFDNK